MIRSYDASGNHLADCGGPGQGPGELDPSTFLTELGTSADGLVFAHAGSEIEAFSADCGYIGTRTNNERLTLGAPMMVADDGVPHRSIPIDREGFPSRWVYGMQAFTADGPAGEPIPQPTFAFEPEEIELRQQSGGGTEISRTTSPYAPRVVWNMLPSNAMVGGVSVEYRFEITHPDGRRTLVARTVEPIPLAGDEAVPGDRSQ